MTDRRKTILAYVQAHPRASMREIGTACGGLSTSAVRWNLHQLAAAGTLRITPGEARSIEIVDTDDTCAALRTAVRLMLDRTERLGGYGVVPWPAIEALRALVE